MPKLKTHKGIWKRVKVTARGKIKMPKHNKGHLLSTKSGCATQAPPEEDAHRSLGGQDDHPAGPWPPLIVSR